jgi:hypothetical protein
LEFVEKQNFNGVSETENWNLKFNCVELCGMGNLVRKD